MGQLSCTFLYCTSLVSLSALDAHEIGKKAGALGVVLLIIAIVYAKSKKNK
jgi:hypothetical protein